jgi:hypothetical protein
MTRIRAFEREDRGNLEGRSKRCQVEREASFNPVLSTRHCQSGRRYVNFTVPRKNAFWVWYISQALGLENEFPKCVITDKEAKM